MTSEVEKRLRLGTAGYSQHGSQWVKNYTSYSSASLLSLVNEIKWNSKNETIRYDETRNIKIVKFSETLIPYKMKGENKLPNSLVHLKLL